MENERSSSPDPAAVVADYCDGVTTGRIIAGKWVKLVVKRHLDDLAHGEERGLVFREDRARHAIEFFGYLRHSKGRWAGEPFTLSAWECFCLWCIFGWYRQDGTRRFREAYLEMARKQGKTCLASGVGLYLFFADGEPGAEVYCGATKRDQARLVHAESVAMVKRSPWLRERITVYRDNLSIEAKRAKFVPLGADQNTDDGLNPSGAIIDEYHAHKNSNLYDVLDTATGARSQPLILIITTAGNEELSPCGQKHDHACKILEGTLNNDSIFAFIASLDDGDDWQDEKVWAKANPNLGVTVTLDDLRDKCIKAQQQPVARAAFLQKRLNIWLSGTTKAIKMEDWNACSDAVDAKALDGRECYGGLDLSKSGDLTALVLLFPPAESAELWKVLPYFWVPSETVRAREISEYYRLWIQQGLIEATEGNVTDYRVVAERVKWAASTFIIKELAYDPWNSSKFVQDLQPEGIQFIEFGQRISNFTEPTKDLMEAILSHKIAHGGHGVLKWMASNLEVKSDANGNIRPVKPDAKKTTARIDGMVALIMAWARATLTAKETDLQFAIV